jgi:selenide,water dikinase
LPVSADARVLVGFGTADDAGVYKIRDDLALVQTVDFFTPIVDDPYDFGRIAAANALSDVYAMGGTPISALNIAAFPVDTLDAGVLEAILAGGAAIAKQAGVAIIGGHTIKDAEPKYGMAVVGTIDPYAIVTNARARAGDVLLLTKPLGTGVLATALKRALIDEARMKEAVDWMVTLNDTASAAMLQANAHAATDVTGFGLLGHAGEMARASGVQLVFHASSVPLMSGVLELIERGCVPGGSAENVQAHSEFTMFSDGVSQGMRIALSDAQTSGGLLVSLAPERLEDFDAQYTIIGEVRDGEGIRVD